MDSVTTVSCVRWIPTSALRNSRFGGRHAYSAADSDSMVDEESDYDEVGTPEVARKANTSNELGQEFDMDNYDEEDQNDGNHMFSVIDSDLKLAKKKDKYMNDAMSDSEDEDYFDVKDTDVLFLAANVEEDACTVEVYLHDTLEGGMYVHHDFMISAYPLALEYVPTACNSKSLVAIGSFERNIDVWELSVQDPMEPVLQLGKKKGHSDAVMCLNLCAHNESVLASGSADKTVRLWDLNKGQSVSTLTHHKDKVQSVSWHPVESGILMSSSFDKSIVVSDQRQNGTASISLMLENEPESAIWARHSPTNILVTDDSGNIAAYDVRKATAGPIWSIKAHSKGACTSISDVLGEPNLLVSGGIDGVAKLWRSDKCSTTPELVFARKLGAEAILSLSTSNDDPSLVVFGGTCPVLWNITDTDVVCKVFPNLPGADIPNIPSHSEKQQESDS